MIRFNVSASALGRLPKALFIWWFHGSVFVLLSEGLQAAVARERHPLRQQLHQYVVAHPPAVPNPESANTPMAQEVADSFRMEIKGARRLAHGEAA